MATNMNGPTVARCSDVGGQKINEQSILEEGRAAQRALAIRTAREVIATPHILDGKRLSRLGKDGVAVFVAELRRSLPKPEKVDPSGHRQRSAAVKPNATRLCTPSSINRAAPAPTKQRAGAAPAKKGASVGKKRAPLDGVAGWWLEADKLPFEVAAYRSGLALGVFLILICIPAILASGF